MSYRFRVFRVCGISRVLVSVTRVTNVCSVTLVMLGRRMGDWFSVQIGWGIRVRVLGTFRVF